MPEKKLADRLREAIRLRGYSIRTEKAYLHWYVRFVRFHKLRHPATMGAPEIEAFLTHLATDQNQALNAILYRHVLQIEIELPPELVRAEKSKTFPTTLTHQEAMLVISKVSRLSQLMTKLLYGSGLRLMECLHLRVKKY